MIIDINSSIFVSGIAFIALIVSLPITPSTFKFASEKEFSALIDTVSIDLRNVGLMNSGTYVAYSTEMGYSPFALKFGFTPVFGASGAYMEYSYRQDSEGNDIWVKY